MIQTQETAACSSLCYVATSHDDCNAFIFCPPESDSLSVLRISTSAICCATEAVPSPTVSSPCRHSPLLVISLQPFIHVGLLCCAQHQSYRKHIQCSDVSPIIDGQQLDSLQPIVCCFRQVSAVIQWQHYIMDKMGTPKLPYTAVRSHLLLGRLVLQQS